MCCVYVYIIVIDAGKFSENDTKMIGKQKKQSFNDRFQKRLTTLGVSKEPHRRMG